MAHKPTTAADHKAEAAADHKADAARLEQEEKRITAADIKAEADHMEQEAQHLAADAARVRAEVDQLPAPAPEPEPQAPLAYHKLYKSPDIQSLDAWRYNFMSPSLTITMGPLEVNAWVYFEVGAADLPEEGSVPFEAATAEEIQEAMNPPPIHDPAFPPPG